MLVKVYNNDMNSALKKLKKAVFDEKILIDYMRHMAYEKPCEKRKRKHDECMVRIRREERKRLKEA